MEELKDNAHIASPPFSHGAFTQSVDGYVANIDAAGGGLIYTRNHIDESSLAAARFANDGHKFAFVNLQIYTAQGHEVTHRGLIGFDDLMEVYEMGGDMGRGRLSLGGDCPRCFFFTASKKFKHSRCYSVL